MSASFASSSSSSRSFARGATRGRDARAGRASARARRFATTTTAAATTAMRARGCGWEEARARRGVVADAGAYDAFRAGVRDEDRATIAQEWDKIMRWAHFVESTRASDESVLASSKKVAIMGGGSFGTAMATLLARNKGDLDVVILMRNAGDADALNAEHRNVKYLPKYELPTNIRATTEAGEALRGCDFIIHAVPVQQSRVFLSGVKDFIDPETPMLCLSKGLETSTCDMMSEIIPAGLGRDQPLAVLSGPTFAVELMQGLPTTIVAASEDEQLAVSVQQLFGSSCLRVNTSTDVTGVELSGAMKNVLAIAAGIVEGLELGNNAMAALVAQGVAEIRWLAGKMGARPETLAGVSGTGDIMLTCFVNLSRNRTVGVRLGAGETLEEVLGSMNQVAEGVATAAAVVQLAKRYRVHLPVLTAVASILDGHMDAKTAVDKIMNLPQVPEV